MDPRRPARSIPIRRRRLLMLMRLNPTSWQIPRACRAVRAMGNYLRVAEGSGKIRCRP